MAQKRTQCELIMGHLRAGYSITPLEALDKFGCQRLAARIDDLQRRGLAIKHELVRERGKTFARYSLEVA